VETKVKNHNWIFLLAAFSILLGIGIQLALAAASDRQSRAAAEAAAELLAASLHDTEVRISAEHKRLQNSLKDIVKIKSRRVEASDLDEIILVNPWNPVPEDYEPVLEDLGWEYWDPDPHYMDVSCAEKLRKMMDDCHEAGNYPYICSAYRTQQQQENLFNNKIIRVMYTGVSLEEAPAIAARSVAVPGTSEHQLGLAVDIIDRYYTNLDAGQENTSTQKWLMENSWKYGFILRYPNGTTDITGIIYEPWHYRYVGEEVAEEIYRLDITLEEYIQLRRGR